MAAHINPHSVDNYLSGVCSTLKEFYPGVQANQRSRLVSQTLHGAKCCYGTPIHHKLPLSCTDLETAAASLSSQPSHDDLLFLAQLFDEFYGLLCLGELVWPDNPSLCMFDKSYHLFLLPQHKSDMSFEGTTTDPQLTFTTYLASCNCLFPFDSLLLLHSDGSIPTRAWFIARLQALFPVSISGHSLCAGGATSLAASGVHGDHIQAMGYCLFVPESHWGPLARATVKGI
ncbi:hypothetical protein BDR05DRAFT_972470 [Suillus weaverae]|nr:hypothetical protein BDR05DRAFT_972470 [Suillus weaverae]